MNGCVKWGGLVYSKHITVNNLGFMKNKKPHL